MKVVAGLGLSATLGGPVGARADASELQGYPDQLGVLVDTTVCIGCRRCEWACKEWNKLPNQIGLKEYEKDQTVFQKVRRTSPDTYTVVNRFANPRDPSRPIYVKKQCMHCYEPACASSCFVQAFTKRPVGAVTYNPSVCVGCRYCIAACPFEIPCYQYYDPWTPQVTKCTFCFDRISKEGGVPACVAICPAETMTFGKRADLVELARKKIFDHPHRYVNHIYGLNEVGGTCWMYLSGVPFNMIGFRTDLGRTPIPTFGKAFLSVASPMYIVFPALAMGLYAFAKRREAACKEQINAAMKKKEGK
ncbi:MAG: 4Fe-4S dicluster domain-containing protein [Desulfomonilaceae bacterium]